jgi:hypothetical protein
MRRNISPEVCRSKGKYVAVQLKMHAEFLMPGHLLGGLRNR